MPRQIPTILVAILFFSIANSYFENSVKATPANDNKQFQFSVNFIEPDWEHMTIDANISSTINRVPWNDILISTTVQNVFYVEGQGIFYWGVTAYNMVPSKNETTDGTTLMTYTNQTTAKFWLIGLAEFYPYDAYLLNLTFTFIDDGLANENNTSVELNFPWWRFWGWTIEKTTTITHTGVIAKIISTAKMSRSNLTGSPYATILMLMFFILGAPFCKSSKTLEHRLVVYVAILIFSATFLFQITERLPPRALSLSFIEVLVLTLMTAASFFIFLSIAENALIYEYKVTSKIKGEIILETFGMVLFIVLFLSQVQPYVNVAQTTFPWVNIPGQYELMLYSSFGLLLKYWNRGLPKIIKKLKKARKRKKQRRMKKVREILERLRKKLHFVFTNRAPNA